MVEKVRWKLIEINGGGCWSWLGREGWVGGGREVNSMHCNNPPSIDMA